MKLEIKHFFDAAHQLEDSDLLITKQCARLHGHTYAVKVVVWHNVNRAGMVIDFRAIKDVIDRFDHEFINDVFKKRGYVIQPTAENIAIILFDWIKELNVKPISVSICEGYKGEDKASWAVYEPES